jgi:transcriptional regulator with XRE-family HTH domain
MTQLVSTAVTNKVAVGGYFRGLRERQGLTQAQLISALTERIGRIINATTLWRVETGKAFPDGDLLAALLDVLRGAAEDVVALQRDESAIDATGDQLAEQRFLLSKGDEQYIRAALESIPPDQRGRFQTVLEELTPEQVEEWLRYGRYLRNDPKRERN